VHSLVLTRWCLGQAELKGAGAVFVAVGEVPTHPACQLSQNVEAETKRRHETTRWSTVLVNLSVGIMGGAKPNIVDHAAGTLLTRRSFGSPMASIC